MKINISDMMDHTDCIPVKMQEKEIISTDRIKRETLKKIHSNAPTARLTGKIPKTGIAVALLALCISTTAAAGVVMRWTGFAYTEDLSTAEKETLMKDASTGYAGEMVNELDGSVHYLDENGNEILILSAEEAADYESAKRKADQQAVQESTSLVDVTTLPLFPNGLTEVETDSDGQFADFMLGNGHMILLHPDGADGYRLNAGDIVTIQLEANDKCGLGFDVFQEGSFLSEEVFLAAQHSYTFTAPEDGLYNFSVMYYSVAASIFTNCRIIINEDM